jgi:hypothetical protein
VSRAAGVLRSQSDAVPARLLSIAELAKYFGVDEHEIHDLQKAGTDFPARQSSDGWCVELDELREWMVQRLEQQDSLSRTPQAPRRTRRSR